MKKVYSDSIYRDIRSQRGALQLTSEISSAVKLSGEEPTAFWSRGGRLPFSP